MTDDILRRVAQVIDSRKNAEPDTSYVASVASQRLEQNFRESRRRSRGNHSCQQKMLQARAIPTTSFTKRQIYGFTV